MDFLQSPNFTPGRPKSIQGIIIHRMAGTLEGAKARFLNDGEKASAHYLIRQDGYILQMVGVADTAWHAGFISNPGIPSWLRPNPNFSTIGIECEDRSQKDDNWWKPALVNALAKLIDDLCREHGIPKDRQHVMGHSDTDPSVGPSTPDASPPGTDYS